MKLRCIIVDDEELAILVIESYLKRIPYIEIVGKYCNALPLYGIIQGQQIDLLFLDIEMPDINGIDFVKSLSNRPFIIFTTARKEYAIESFELNIIDYLIKPISFERLLKSINRVMELKSQKQSIEIINELHDFIFLKENKKNIKVYIKDILYFESVKDYVKVITKNKTVITKQQLSYFESILGPENILRIHRSFIVMIEHIEAFDCSEVEVGGIKLPIGRSYKEETLKKLELCC
jgi:DNA-binding LytR/AlgR family response regulator